MLIERPPLIFRMLLPGALWRVPSTGRPTLYLTFDDGPIPEVTPWVLDRLEERGIKATFFMVGDNARRYPELVEEVKRRGHQIGNHTMHHLQGAKLTSEAYLTDVEEADHFLDSELFRPPHGWLRPHQAHVLGKEFRVVMYDLVTRDYSRHLTADDVVANVKRYARDGSIIVFHDSLKSWPRLQEALPQSLDWLLAQGYEFGILDATKQ